MELSESSQRIFEQSGNRHLYQLANPEQDDLADYDRDKIFLGWNIGGKEEFQNLVLKYIHQGYDEGEAINLAIRMFGDVVGKRREEVYLDRSSANLVFIGGERGAGKSFNLRGISNRSTKAGVNNVLIDVQGEYYTNNLYNGIQEELKNLRPQESKQTVATKVLTPVFIRRIREEYDLPIHGRDQEWHDTFKFQFSDMDVNDLQFMLEHAFGDSEAAQADARILVGAVRKQLQDGGMLRSFDDLIDLARSIDEREEQSFRYHDRVRTLRTAIETGYKQYRFLGPSPKLDLETVFDEYDCIALNLHDDGKLPQRLQMKELYTSFLVKRIRTLVQQDRIDKPIHWVIDEAHKVIPANTPPEQPPSKEQFRTAIKQDRRHGFRVTMASQEPEDVQAKNFLNQTRYFLIPQNMDLKPMRYLLKRAKILNSQRDIGRSKWKQITGHLDQYQWIFADKQRQFWCALEPASPLAAHRQE